MEDSAFVRERLIALAAEVPGVELSGVAADGEGAIHLFEQGHPDAILLDIGLPGMSGLHVLRHIRQRSASAVVMIYTGSACTEMAECCQALGANYFLDKSDNIGLLISALRQAVNERNASGPLGTAFPLPTASI